MTDMERTGGCVCGAVRFRATLKTAVIDACHCGQCQRWTGGGPHFAVSVDAVAFEDEAAIATYRASNWGERGFCRTCGSTLYWKMQGRPLHSVAVGLLDDPTGLTVGEEIFVDRRPDWLPAWPDASQSTEAEEFAKLEKALETET